MTDRNTIATYMKVGMDIRNLPGAYAAPCTMGTGYFPGVKRPGRGVDHPPPSSARGQRKSRTLPLLPFWAFVACSRLNFTFNRNLSFV